MANHYSKDAGLTKQQIETAMRHSQSNRAAARYLGVTIITYRKYASLYYDEETGKTLYEKHKNLYGIGIKKNLKHKTGDTESVLMDILQGKVIPTNYTAERLKNRMIKEQLIKEECACCGFKEQRILDYKVPLLLTFKDMDKRNWKRDNLELLCYNCYFLQVGDIFNKKQKEAIEGMMRVKGGDIQEELQIENIHMEVVKDVYRNHDTYKPAPEEDTTGESILFRM